MTISWKKTRAKALQEGRIQEEQVSAQKAKLLAEVHAYRLAELRQILGLSQQDLATRLEISQSRVSRIERGDLGHTEIDTLRAFAQALGGKLELSIKLDDESFVVG